MTRFEKLHMLGDEYDEELKGEIINYALISTYKVVDFEPSHFEQACKHKVWVQAMQEEMDSIIKKDTWNLCNLLKGKRCVGSKWIYKIKYNNDGSVERYKARLVAKGFTQNHGIDFKEIFA